MKKLSQPQIILNVLSHEPQRHFFAHELSNRNTQWGWLGNDGDRRARDLARKGRINRWTNPETGYVEFWHKEEKMVALSSEVKQLQLI